MRPVVGVEIERAVGVKHERAGCGPAGRVDIGKQIDTQHPPTFQRLNHPHFHVRDPPLGSLLRVATAAAAAGRDRSWEWHSNWLWLQYANELRGSGESTNEKEDHYATFDTHVAAAAQEPRSPL